MSQHWEILLLRLCLSTASGHEAVFRSLVSPEIASQANQVAGAVRSHSHWPLATHLGACACHSCHSSASSRSAPPDKLLKRAGALARATGGRETRDCSATTTACARQHPPETRVAPSRRRGLCEEGGGGPRRRADLPAGKRGCRGQAGAPPRRPRHPRRCCGSVRSSDTATVFFFLHPLSCCGAPPPPLSPLSSSLSLLPPHA